jgi:hypothetical protein
VHVDRAFFDEHMVAPDAVQQLGALCTRSGWVIRKCSRRNSVGPSFTHAVRHRPPCHTAGGRVQHFSPATSTARPAPQGPCAAARHGCAPSVPSAKRAWSGSRRRRRPARDLVGLVGARSEHDHGQLTRARVGGASGAPAARPTGPAASSPAAPGRAARGRPPPARLRRPPQRHLKPRMAQVDGNQLGNRGFVFDNQHALMSGSWARQRTTFSTSCTEVWRTSVPLTT